MLEEKGHFAEFAQFIRQHGLEASDADVINKLKSILWAVVRSLPSSKKSPGRDCSADDHSRLDRALIREASAPLEAVFHSWRKRTCSRPSSRSRKSHQYSPSEGQSRTRHRRPTWKLTSTLHLAFPGLSITFSVSSLARVRVPTSCSNSAGRQRFHRRENRQACACRRTRPSSPSYVPPPF